MKKRITFLYALILISLLLSGCRHEEAEPPVQEYITIIPGRREETANRDEGEIISGTGILKHIPLAGGFMGIIGDDGRNYNPINLRREFRLFTKGEDWRVRFEARVRKVATIQMWGIPVEIVKMERL